jgi:hypothetical protein
VGNETGGKDQAKAESKPEILLRLDKRLTEWENLGVNVEKERCEYFEAGEKFDAGYAAAGDELCEQVNAALDGRLKEHRAAKRAFFIRTSAFGSALLAVAIIIGCLMDSLSKSLLCGVFPWSLFAWGVIGSAFFLIVSLYLKYRAYDFPPAEIPKGIIRLVIGGVLGTISFFAIKYGVVNLPGTMGDEAKASFEAAKAKVEERDGTPATKPGAATSFLKMPQLPYTAAGFFGINPSTSKTPTPVPEYRDSKTAAAEEIAIERPIMALKGEAVETESGEPFASEALVKTKVANDMNVAREKQDPPWTASLFVIAAFVFGLFADKIITWFLNTAGTLFPALKTATPKS